MKTLFDSSTRDEVIRRITTLTEASRPGWGKMNTIQMLKHCTRWDEMVFGRRKFKRMFLGLLFGRMAIKRAVDGEGPMQHNAPTVPGLKIQELNGDIASEKKKWIATIEEYGHYSNPEFVHPFFGRMTRDQIGRFAYKHADHHLRQFRC